MNNNSMRLADRLLNSNKGCKCCYEEVEKWSRIRSLYVVRIDERITKFNGRFMSREEQ